MLSARQKSGNIRFFYQDLVAGPNYSSGGRWGGNGAMGLDSAGLLPCVWACQTIAPHTSNLKTEYQYQQCQHNVNLSNISNVRDVNTGAGRALPRPQP